MDALEAARIARELVEEVGVKGQFPVPVERIAHYLGYDTKEFRPDESTADVMAVVDYTSHEIYLNGGQSPRKQQFALAHEIGHVRLGHEEFGNRVDFKASFVDPKDEVEVDANTFAAELLMPRADFCNAAMKLNHDLSLMAKQFGVTESTAKIRAEYLGIA